MLKGQTSCNVIIPLQRGLVPFQVRSLVQMRVEALSASMVNPGEHWKLTVWLYEKSVPNLTPLAGTPGSPQLITAGYNFWDKKQNKTRG